MNTKLPIMTFTAVLLLACAATGADKKDEYTKKKEQLQTRMKARYAHLVKLKNDGKVGEVVTGYAAVTKAEYADDEYEKDKTVASLLSAENADRRTLYKLVAKKHEEEVADVAKANAVRIFKEASLDHWFKARDGKWRTKREMIKKNKKKA